MLLGDHRQCNRYVEFSARFASRNTSTAMRRRERRDGVRAALDRLPERDREVLVLRHLEGLSTADAAAVLGVSEGAFKSRHLRALQRLRSLLGAGFSGESP